jgi:N-methylhydantoinase B/oxoprolinase/acetone carboxylase alpha subunit
MSATEDRRSGITITNREIYDALLLNTQLTRDLASKVEVIEKRDGDHETRVRALERWRWEIGGVITLVSVGASAAVSAWLGG